MKNKITKEDLIGYTLEEMLTKSYGAKGTSSRKKAERAINKKMKNLKASTI